MSLDVTSNAAEVSHDLAAALVDDAASRANHAASTEALRLVDPRTPRRTGRLAAGLRVVSASDGWALVDAVPYSVVVDARTGFATRTIIAAEDTLVGIYEDALQEAFDAL